MPSSVVRLPLRPFAIIGALLLALLALTGCSAVRLAYNSAPSLAYWWLDSYFDFDGEQSLRIKADLQAVQDWHRREELPQLLQILKDLQTMAPKPVTAAQVCGMVTTLQARVQAPLDRVAPSIAAIAPTLQAAQIDSINREFDKRDKKWREEWLEGSVAERSERRAKQIIERAESFYGRLEPAQVAIIRAYIDASSFDGPRQHKEMLRRQQDATQVLNTLRTTRVPTAQATAEIRGLLERTMRAPDPAYRQYIDLITNESCAAMASLHNSSTASQRARLLQTLRDYDGDARALYNQLPQGQATPPSGGTSPVAASNPL